DLVKQNIQLESKKFVLVAHSMGGLVARSYMNEHDTDYGPTFQGRRAGERISQLMTLATAHDGTYGSNGKARASGHTIWQKIFSKLDERYWGDEGGCVDCVNDPSHPNRSDLRFDNYDGLWNENSDYVTNPFEKNGWLQNMPKTYDRLISAYFGFLGANPDAMAVGELDPCSLYDYVNLSKGDHFALLLASGVLLERIKENEFGTAEDCLLPSGSLITFVNNDGLVPIGSAMYEEGDVAKRIRCAGANHEQMKDGAANCTVVGTNINKSLFNLILDELLPSTTINSATMPSGWYWPTGSAFNH